MIEKMTFMATLPRKTVCCLDCQYVEKFYRESEISVWCKYDDEGKKTGEETLPSHCQLNKLKKPYLGTEEGLS